MIMAHYAMYTKFGDDAVDAIVRQARILNMNWNQVYKELENLSRREGFEEATDTAVRESVYIALYEQEADHGFVEAVSYESVRFNSRGE